jgi:uncharacterized protein YcbK (DUF882 family)
MRYFQIEEFDSRDVKGSGSNMDATFLSMIDEARAIANVPFKITSGYRTEKHNNKIGGVKDSSHLKGLAADVQCTDSRSRYIMLNALNKVGFCRIGISDTFIHCDISTDKSQQVIWVY